MNLGARFRGRQAAIPAFFQRRPQVWPKPVARHDEDAPVGFAWSNLQIPVDGPGVEQSFIFFIGQDGRRREGFQQMFRGNILRVGRGLPFS